MKEFERKQLLERIERDGATIGASIPNDVEIQDETLDLQTFVFEIRRRETVPPGERERVEQAKRNLRRERLERKQQIEEADISREEGDRLAETIIGLDRALNELETLGPVNLEAEAQAKKTADQKRWTRFLKKALGNTEDSDSHGVRGQR